MNLVQSNGRLSCSFGGHWTKLIFRDAAEGRNTIVYGRLRH
ncbi:MAG: hypothetical protein ACTS46_01070 [Candidatus Hodgkinia cicadicola]